MAATNKTLRFFDLKADTRNGAIPHFQESIPQEGGGYHLEKYNAVSGILTDAFLEAKTFEDDSFNAFKIVLQDGSETIRLAMRPNESCYSILSRLGSSTPGLPVEITVRKGTTKEGFDFAKVAVSQGGKNLEWKIDLTKPIEGDKRAYFEEYFVEVIKPLCR